MIAVDATTLISLGAVGELALLTVFDDDVGVHEPVAAEVTTQPAKHNLDAFGRDHDVPTLDLPPREARDRAREVLGESTLDGDVALVGHVIAHSDPAVVSDDRRVRTVVDGLGATVTGTIGVVVRAVDDGRLTAEDGKQLVRRVDGQGLHMTGELRERALELIDGAGEN